MFSAVASQPLSRLALRGAMCPCGSAGRSGSAARLPGRTRRYGSTQRCCLEGAAQLQSGYPSGQNKTDKKSEGVVR